MDKVKISLPTAVGRLLEYYIKSTIQGWVTMEYISVTNVGYRDTS